MIFNFFKKKKSEIRNVFYPALSGEGIFTGPGSAGVKALATVHKCLRVWSDFLMLAKLKPADHPFVRLLNNPNSYMSRRDFFDSLVSSYFLYGNFFCVVESNDEGRITALVPYKQGQIWRYARGGDSNDGVNIERRGSYFRDWKGRVYLSSENQILHIKDLMFSESDVLNGRGRFAIARSIVDSGGSLQDLSEALATSGLSPPMVLSGMDPDSSNYQKIRERLKKFFSSGYSQKSGSVLSLPEGFKLLPLSLSAKESDFKFLAELNDLQIARIMNVPIGFLGLADDQTNEKSQKEQNRFWIKSSLKSFLDSVAGEFSRIAGGELMFETGQFINSDLREKSMYISQLVSAGVLSKEKARELT